MYNIKFMHLLFPILPKYTCRCDVCQLKFSYSISGRFFPSNFVRFRSINFITFTFIQIYWCTLLIHLDSVHFGNRLVINKCVVTMLFLWKICRLSVRNWFWRRPTFLEHVITLPDPIWDVPGVYKGCLEQKLFTREFNMELNYMVAVQHQIWIKYKWYKANS